LSGITSVQVDLQQKVLIAAEQERPDVAQQRTEWRAMQPELDPAHLVFIDET